MRARVKEVIDGVNGCESAGEVVDVDVVVGVEGDVEVASEEGVGWVVDVALDIAKIMPFDVAAFAAVGVGDGVLGDNVIVVAGCWRGARAIMWWLCVSIICAASGVASDWILLYSSPAT